MIWVEFLYLVLGPVSSEPRAILVNATHIFLRRTCPVYFGLVTASMTKCLADRRIPCCFRKSLFCTYNSSCVDFQYLLAKYGHTRGYMRGCGLWYRLSHTFNHLQPGFAQQRPNALVMSAPSIRIQGRTADLEQAWYHTILVTCFEKLLVFD